MSKLKVQKVSDTNDKTLPVFAEIDKQIDRIRDKAYELFANRGFGGGHEFDDWLQAEHEICWPAAELTENDDEFKLEVALAGFKTNDISVTATPRDLIVKASHNAGRKQPEESAKTCWTEFRSNDVYRRVDLPNPIDVDEISARFENGLLTIEASKAAAIEDSPKHVEISTAA